jgi:cell shape-determining protein MreC
VQEIKRLNNEIASIKNELAKYDEQLEDCRKYKEFLNQLTPPEWFEEIKKQVGASFSVPELTINTRDKLKIQMLVKMR